MSCHVYVDIPYANSSKAAKDKTYVCMYVKKPGSYLVHLLFGPVETDLIQPGDLEMCICVRMYVCITYTYICMHTLIVYMYIYVKHTYIHIYTLIIYTHIYIQRHIDK